MFVIPVLGRERQGDPWGLLVNQSSLIDELHFLVRDWAWGEMWMILEE